MRKHATLTPCVSAERAACSQAWHSSWLKQPWDVADSLSTWSCHKPYQPTAEPLTSTAGLVLSRAISLTTSPVMSRRDWTILSRLACVHGPLLIGSPARLTIVSILLSSGS